KAVDILGGVDGVNDAARIYVPRQRQLDEYPIDPVIAIELLDLGDECCLRDLSRQGELERGKSDANASPPLASHIDFACRIAPDEDRGEAGGHALLVAQPRGTFGDPTADLGSDRLAIDHLRLRHAALLCCRASKLLDSDAQARGRGC